MEVTFNDIIVSVSRANDIDDDGLGGNREDVVDGLGDDNDDDDEDDEERIGGGKFSPSILIYFLLYSKLINLQGRSVIRDTNFRPMPFQLQTCNIKFEMRNL